MPGTTTRTGNRAPRSIRMKNTLLPLLFAAVALAQGTDSPVSFPSTPLPVAVSVFGEFNQLGTPRFTMGVAAIYPIIGSVGIYGTTTADILPQKATDPVRSEEHTSDLQSPSFISYAVFCFN